MVEIRKHTFDKKVPKSINMRDNYLSIEWLFGQQGHPASARLSLMVDNEEKEKTLYAFFISKDNLQEGVFEVKDLRVIEKFLEYGQKLHNEFGPPFAMLSCMNTRWDYCGDSTHKGDNCIHCLEKIEMQKNLADAWFKKNPVPKVADIEASLHQSDK